MRSILSAFMLLTSLSVLSQSSDTVRSQPASTAKKVSFITRVDKSNETKDGIYLNGYVVNLSGERIRELHGKKVRISGRVTTVKGLKSESDKEIAQGRGEDARHILSPKVDVLPEL